MLIWVQSADFIGRCRRAVQRGFRIGERRKRDLGEPLPALATLLRQLSLHDLSAPDPALRAHFRVRLEAAIALAGDQEQTACAAILAELAFKLDAQEPEEAFEALAVPALTRATTALV